MSSKTLNLFVIFLLFLKNQQFLVDGANILGLMGVPSPSHHIWNSVLIHRLAELGHNVTVLSVDLPKPHVKVPSNLHYIYLEEGYSMYKNEFQVDITTYIGLKPLESIRLFYDLSLKCSVGVVRSKGLQVLLDYPDDFKVDLIIHDYTLGPELLGFLHKFKYPSIIGVSAFLNPPNTIDFMSNHYFPAYVPYHSTNYTTEMSFWERLENTIVFIADTAYRRLVYYPKVDALIKPIFGEDLPSVAELAKHTSLSLVNSHPVVTFVEPVPPNVIEVGGMQMLDPKPLPTDLAEFMNKTKNGVVLVSFGTNMKSSDFKEEQIEVIFNALSQLPQYDFIWKFDVKFLKKKLPPNVIVRSFLPQTDLLAHPNMKAFVTHCGGLSTHEAVWRGVPMIGVPLYFDQHRNLRQALLAGIAVKLDFLTMTTNEFRDTIKNVLEDRQMAARSKYVSSIFRDRPMKPLDTAIWWVEYILRNPKPTHLISPASKLNILQANSIDVLFMLWTLFAFIIYLTVHLLSLTWKKFNGSKKPPSASKLKRN